MFIVDPYGDHAMHCGVESFYGPIRRWVVSCGAYFVDGQVLTKLAEKLALEIWATISENLDWAAVYTEHSVYQ